MITDSRLELHLRTDNGPLPQHLQPPLNSLLGWLDRQKSACKRDRQRIEESIEEKYARIEALEHEIKNLKAVRKTIIATEWSIHAKKTQYKGTLSALRRAPPEIIGKIIAYAIHTVGDYVGPDDRRCFQNLRAVCRLWRRTALSTPYLWRSIGIGTDDFPFAQHQTVDPHHAELFAQSLVSWYARGGQNAPLNLSLLYVSLEHAVFAFILMRHLQLNLTTAMVAIESNRYNDGGYYGLKFLERPATDTSVTLPLKDIAIWLGLPFVYQRTNAREMVDLTDNWPHLSTLSLFCNRDNSPTFIVHQTLSKLTLRSTHLPAEDVEFILAGLPQLESLCLLWCTPRRLEHGETSESEAIYIHAALRQVEFGDGVVQTFLSRLTCPSLETLVAAGETPKDEERGAELACLRAFIKRSGVSIPFTFYGQICQTSVPLLNQ
ncbi:hypothetical protein BKA70DRAFT_1352817 [Coprinopsis sp. MPI-PUGE-AT-0042]|nr:hypothetical protein BKA70DRAFT_1352817 [Coprinopsis sp. MPI-PUGE-AT-0042]